jgi:hypothetical protein
MHIIIYVYDIIGNWRLGGQLGGRRRKEEGDAYISTLYMHENNRKKPTKSCFKSREEGQELRKSNRGGKCDRSTFYTYLEMSHDTPLYN